jgi:hypothetical protein
MLEGSMETLGRKLIDAAGCSFPLPEPARGGPYRPDSSASEQANRRVRLRAQREPHERQEHSAA